MSRTENDADRDREEMGVYTNPAILSHLRAKPEADWIPDTSADPAEPETKKTTTELRDEYRAIRSRSHCEIPQEFDLATTEYLAKRGLAFTGENFVTAAKTVSFRCRRCAGTGAFITRVENGQPKGPGGSCYRCGGKGTQNDADSRRNYGADLHQRIY